MFMFKRIGVLPPLRRQSRYIHKSAFCLSTERKEINSNDNNSNDVSNITNVLNELNDEDDFYSRNVRYRTTASELVEKMTKKQEVDGLDNDDRAGQLATMSVDDDKEQKTTKEKKMISIERYLLTHQLHKQLREANFNEKQSKLILELILSHLEMNTNKMILKHAPELDLENENYLFQATQQELKSEVSASRDSELNLLINSSILLKRSFQSLEDELGINYKLMDNSIKLELNQFKHENNLQSKQLDLKTQVLNNKIVTDLVGDLRSYTESLRWQLTRSALLTIFAMVFLAISSYTIIKNADEETPVPQALSAPEIDYQQISAKIENNDGKDEEEEELVLEERL